MCTGQWDIIRLLTLRLSPDTTGFGHRSISYTTAAAAGSSQPRVQKKCVGTDSKPVMSVRHLSSLLLVAGTCFLTSCQIFPVTLPGRLGDAYCLKFVSQATTFGSVVYCTKNVSRCPSWPGIHGTQVKSSGNKNRMSPSRRLDGAYFSETPPSWHVRPHFSLIAIVNYYLFCKYQFVGKGPWCGFGCSKSIF
jgi:hypothetical protein